MQHFINSFTRFMHALRPRSTQRMRLAMIFATAVSAMTVYYLVSPPKARGLSSDVVISQVYGGGGATSGTPTYINDYVELFNRSSNPVTLTGYALQYGSSTGNFGNTAGQIYAISTVTIQPGKYLMIQVGAAGTVGGAFPVTPDQTTTNISMSAASGKIALANTATALGCGATATPCTLPDVRILDSVSYGASNNGEGGTTVNNGVALNNTQAGVRKNNGCTETDNNNSDFNVVTAPVPRNSASAANPCTPIMPTLNVNDVALSEGNAGTTTFSFTVSLTSPALAGGVSFTATTADNTATTADNDYQFKTENLTILEGQTSATFDVLVNGDTTFEPNESFFVNITAVTGATAGDVQGLGTINNDDVSPLPLLSINDVSMAEGNAGTTTFTFTISLTAPAGVGGVTFDISTQDGTATVANNDYVLASQIGKTIAEGNSSTTFDVTVNGDTTGEPDETFTVNITNVVGANVNDGTGLGTIQNDDLTLTLIHDIQGSAETPNFAGTSRTIQGIVVGDFQNPNGLGGFFVEEEQSDWDADENTSEGIFVFDSAGSVAVNVGDKVTVAGTVLNFGGPPGLTELSPVTSVVVNSTGNTLPPVKTVALPVSVSFAADFEKYEGMLVQFVGQTLFVTDNQDLGSFGELSLSATAPLYIPTNSIDPNDNPATGTSITGNSNVPAVTAQQTANNNSRIILDDGRSGSNLAPLAFIGPGTNSTVRRGDSVTNLAGVMSYGFGSYRVEPSGTVSFNALNPRTAAPDSVGSGTLRVASFNVENYFATTGTGRGPDNATELMRKRDKVAAAIIGLNADVIGLIELEKGTQATPNAAVNDIVAALNAIAGPGTYAAISTPTALYTVPVGTDTDIKSGMIYRTTNLTTVGASLTDTAAAVGAYSRAPIAQTFQQTSNSERFSVVVNHFRSKSCPGSGDDADMGDGQACFNGRRRSQAQAVVAFVNNTLVPVDPDVLVVGDLNAYGQEDPIDVFRGAGFGDVLNQYVSAANQYSYTFNGETGRLDHAFATSSLNSKMTGATIWHINTDEPTVFDYNTESKPDDRYAPTPYASADHDPVLVAFSLGTICPTIVVSPSIVPSGTAGSLYGPVQFMQEGGNGPITWSVSSNNLPAGLTLNPMTGQLSGTPTVAVGVNIVIRATDSNNCFGEVTVTLQINCPTITISPSSGSPTVLTGGTVGQAYSQTFTAAPAGGGYTYSIPAPSIPAGLTFNPATGLLSGTPTTTGTFGFTVTATGFGNCTGQQSYSLTIGCQTITISPAGPALPGGTIGSGYSQQLTASNGSGTVNFTIQSGSFPAGITMSLSGLISGTPTATGTANFTVLATDANNCIATQAYTLAIGCQTITVSPAGPALPPGMSGMPYSQMFTQTGGNGTTNFSISAGTLPMGLTLSSGGLLSGTPTEFGNFGFTVRATDANACFGQQAYTLVINPPCGTINVTPMVVPNGFVGTAYTATFNAGGGTAPYSFTISAGTQPTGLTLSSGGELTGTPTAAGTFTFTVKATDTNGCMGTQVYTVIISGSGLQFYPLPSPVRLLDTRSGAGISGCTTGINALAAGSTRTQPARTMCSMIPANATAVIGNITVIPSGPGFLTLFPSDATQPTVANSNFKAGEVTNNFFTVGLGADGAFKIFTSAETQVIIDLTGYYAPPGAGGLFYHPLPSPVRLVETRAGQTGCFQPAQLVGTNDPNADPNLDLQVQGRSPGLPSPCNSIPNDAAVLVGNATTVFPNAPLGSGYLTIYPSDAMRPTVASSNYANNDVINGPFAVKLGADGKFKVYTFSTTDLVIDITGYYSTSPTDANGAGLLFSPLPTPMRLLETRPDFPGLPLVGCYRTNMPIAGQPNVRTQMVWGMCSDQPITIPNTARAIVGNATVINPVAAGFLTFYPGDVMTAPNVATSNYPFPVTFGYNRHYYVGLSPVDGTFKILTQFTTDLIVDVSGYFAP